MVARNRFDISAREFEELQRLRAFERRAYRINDLPAEIRAAGGESPRRLTCPTR